MKFFGRAIMIFVGGAIGLVGVLYGGGVVGEWLGQRFYGTPNTGAEAGMVVAVIFTVLVAVGLLAWYGDRR